MNEVNTVEDFYNYCNGLCDSLYKTEFGAKHLAPFSKWLNKTPEVIKSNNAKDVLVRCANDANFGPHMKTTLFQDFKEAFTIENVSVAFLSIVFILFFVFQINHL